MTRIWNYTELTEGVCNLCGGIDNIAVYTRLDGIKIVQCKNCGLVYANPRPKDALIAKLYENDYFASNSSIGYRDYFSRIKKILLQGAAELRLRILNDAGIKIEGDVLDVGCATGEFCHVLQQNGLNVTGIDISVTAVKKARARYPKINFLPGTINMLGPNERYDVIFAFQVLEHLLDPEKFFAKVSRFLRENGVFCMTTPSFECAESVGFDKWIGFSSSFEHIYFFSKKTISQYARRHKMKVECVLYGGGHGINNPPREEKRIKAIARSALNSIYLLKFLRFIREWISLQKHDYQSREYRHNLFMVFRRAED